jgi:hypothetical protein
MSVVHPERADLTQFLAGYDRARNGVIGLLSSLTVSTDSIPNSEWTVREAAVHLIGVSRLYRQFLHGIASPIRGSWAELAVLNAGYFLALDEAEPRELGRLLDEATASYAHDVALLDALQPCPWHLGQTLDVATEVALETSELLMHGWDIGNTIGRRLWDDEAANTALSGMRWLWAATVPPDTNRSEATLAVSVNGSWSSRCG